MMPDCPRVETCLPGRLQSRPAESAVLLARPRTGRRSCWRDTGNAWPAKRFSWNATVVRIVARLARRCTSTGWIIALLLMSSLPEGALAQDAWNFSTEVPCASTPVQGLPFQKCLISNVRTFRVGTVQAWRMTFTDSKSEFAIGFYKMVEAHGVGGMSPVSYSNMAEWVRTADALKHITSGGTGWATSGGDANARYVTFQRAQRQCIAFVHNGSIVNGQVNWILGAAFCRDAVSPIPFSEAQFIADAIRVRD